MSVRKILTSDRALCSRLVGLGITMFGYYDNKNVKAKLDIHDHGSCYEICFLEKGMQPYYIHPSDSSEGAQMYCLYGGDVFVTHPHERHSTGSFNQLRGRMYWINLDIESYSLLGLSAQNIDLLKSALSNIDNRIIQIPRSVSDRFKESFKLHYQPSEERIFRACQLISLFIMELSVYNKKINDKGFADRTVSSKIIEAISFIDSNLLESDLSVQMIAEHLHYSKSYTMTAFRKEIGMSIHEYILNQKVEYARKLLENYSITETAHLLNFSSSQHFSKVFKDYTNMTPNEYKLLRATED